MSLRRSIKQYCDHVLPVLDDLFIAIEARNTADQHTALAALIGLLEILKSATDNDGDEPDPAA